MKEVAASDRAFGAEGLHGIGIRSVSHLRDIGEEHGSWVRAQTSQPIRVLATANGRQPQIGGDSNETVRRIEDWIVSALGIQGSSTAEEDLQDLFARIAPSRHYSKGRTSSSGLSTGEWGRFHLTRRRGITVVVLKDKTLIKELELGELASDLLALVEAGHTRMVLNFGKVERLSSWAVGPIAEVAKRCAESRAGTLKVCGLRSPVAAIFTIAGLGRDLALFPDETSAIDSPWPEAPDFKPLPIAVLAALTRAAEVAAGETILPVSAESGNPRSLRFIQPSQSPNEGTPPMSAARLIVQVGPLKGRAVVVGSPKFVIGRDPRCQLRPCSPTVSRRHAALERDGNRLMLRDLGSTNGTLLNGRRLRGAEELHDGDQVELGPLKFKVEFKPEQVEQVAEPKVDDLVARWFHDEDKRSIPIASGAATEDDLATSDDAEGALEFKQEMVEDVVVVTPLVPDLDDDATVDRLRQVLVALFDQQVSRKVVVNLTHVGHLSGRAIGMLVAHYLKLDRSGGALRICQAKPRVASLLEQVRLEMLVECHATVDDAILLTWPEGSNTPQQQLTS